MSSVTGNPIPWTFEVNPIMRQWVWITEHFEARIITEGNSFVWEVGDLIISNQGLPRFLGEGRAGIFTAAENAVKDLVSKAYQTKFGYRDFAGPLATTFLTSGGKTIDFGPYEGVDTCVHVALPSGEQRSYTGILKVHHFEVRIVTPSGTMRIHPPYITNVVRTTGGSGHAAGATSRVHGRIFEGNPGPSCTGMPGFITGTIDHTGELCPIHEGAVISATIIRKI
jgi:hypothetical protein